VKQSLEKPFWNSIVTTRSMSRSRLEIYTDEGVTAGEMVLAIGVADNRNFGTGA